ncbi:type II toxin-antitoxin system HipA family toxin [Cellulomonas shaoxiangyii]|uniref:Type II toxin-antitoxin system HipA family toxin n=1 Tax=Cellulomonas shaoxiangyii TaxID=2566013 RepID=A0A4V1CMF6_9CELL|nr:type II toxin-antitoxin system HipA family toxin [Cellulomonas shaoxiangyii]QCB92775.1 type II toxin-antitoxin system HipA family toxin [Cellulomonas shaoxiangyii]TGY84090.1 type II toxin-antitoxin system HipA family toxin [Cellulomonas shaoxiangyii]
MSGERHLDVLLYGRVIGHVTQSHSGRHTFTYDAQYAGDVDATPLSLSMPLAPASYPGRRIDPFMAGLLPDSEEVRERWARLFDVSAVNYFALLEHMGLDCAGAVQFVGARDDEDLARPGRLEPVSDADIAARLRDLRSDDSAWTVPGERWSLAGAQGKFTLARDAQGRWCEPVGDAPSTHIIKPGVPGYRDQALNEHVCLTAVGACGLRAVSTTYTHFDDEPALVVGRYDRRRTADGSVTRIHQEDMCQALSVHPRRKYEASRGPSAADVAQLLREVATDPERDVLELVQAVIVNYLIGAPDAHAKNYSVLLAGPQVRFAPLYDIASALPYDARRADSEITASAMSIGGRRTFGTVEPRHWDRFADGCRVPRDLVRGEVRRLAGQLPGALEAAFDPFADSELRTRMLTRVQSLADVTLAALR